MYKEILDTLEWEKKEGRTMSPGEIFKTPVARRRLLVGMSVGTSTRPILIDAGGFS